MMIAPNSRTRKGEVEEFEDRWGMLTTGELGTERFENSGSVLGRHSTSRPQRGVSRSSYLNTLKIHIGYTPITYDKNTQQSAVCLSGQNVCLIIALLEFENPNRNTFASVYLQRRVTARNADFLCLGLLNLQAYSVSVKNKNNSHGHRSLLTCMSDLEVWFYIYTAQVIDTSGLSVPYRDVRQRDVISRQKFKTS